MKKKWVKPVLRPMIAGSADNLVTGKKNETGTGVGPSRAS